MDDNLRNLCEQIQEDIRTFATSENPSVLSELQIDHLCEIVVMNFHELGIAHQKDINQGSFYKIEQIEFDLDWDEDPEYFEELDSSLSSEWEGKIVGPLLEEDLVDYITEQAGWCINYVAYKQCSK